MTAKHTPGGWFSFSPSGKYSPCRGQSEAESVANRRNVAFPWDGLHRAVRLIYPLALNKTEEAIAKAEGGAA